MFSWFVLLIELNAWEDEWLVGISTLQEGKKESQKKKKKKKKKTNNNNIFKNDLVCWQFINSSKLGANWNGQNFKNHKHWFLKI